MKSSSNFKAPRSALPPDFEREKVRKNPENWLPTPEWKRIATEADFKSARMAALCGISERHLQRIFKERIGCAPSQWLRVPRCRLAKSLIIQGYSNKEVAAELGFLTNAHFCREFKKAFGMSPRKFVLHLSSLRENGSGSAVE